MPTISQLPPASSVSAEDEVPISQAGTARAASVGTLLSSTQPVITVASPSLLGRTSLGAGGPEQVDVGNGLKMSGGTLIANGLDHADFALASNLSADTDLVISNQGRPMLMQALLLRELFSAGQNVGIDANGVISAASVINPSGTMDPIGSISALPVVTSLSSEDLVAVARFGSNCAIAYHNLLGGVTIDQAQVAGTASDSDMFWVAQNSNVMTGQTLGAIWSWIVGKLPTYKTLTVEIATNTNLDATVHNGRLLVCSQPVTLIPLINNMGSGFQCTVINASSGNITLGSGFVSSSGSLVLTPWQSATLSCAAYSAGTIAFAAMPIAAAVITPPGQVGALSGSGISLTSITMSWQAPSSGGTASNYIVQYRPTGASLWSGSATVSATTCQLTALQPGTSYDITVAAQNAAGVGAASAITTVLTSGPPPTTPPSPVSGLTAAPLSSTAMQLSWSSQAGPSAATTFTIQYRVTGASVWAATIPGISGTGTIISGLQASTSYDLAAIGVNAAGAGAASTIITAITLTAAQSVSSITWNVVPAGTYTRGNGAIGVNAQVSPASSPVQFGFSPSAATPPTSWVAAILVNTNLWGAYVPTPATAGNWYTWGEGLDGSAATVSPSPFSVQ
jgi:hypothetical protein